MSWLDKAIGFVSPQAAYQRQSWRLANEALTVHAGAVRAYAAADRSRLSADRFTTGGSADAALAGDLAEMRNRSRQMYRDNPLMRSAVVNLLGWLIGDGIEIVPVHPDKAVAKKAREIWKAAASARVWGDGQDFYGSQVLRAAEMIKGGEGIAMWMPEGRLPDARLALYQADYVDTTKNEVLKGGGRIAMGVEYDRRGTEVATWFFENHPGDLLATFSLKSVRVPARRYQRLFWRTDVGQSRGVPWDHAGQGKAHDIDALKEAIRTKKRVEACLALVVRRDDDGKTGPIGAQAKNASGLTEETLRPGMILNAGLSGGLDIVNPSSSGEAEGFMRGEVRDFAVAIGVPYFILSGDVSDANYTTLRADLIAFFKRLDLWQHHTLSPAFEDDFLRVMRREAFRTGDMRLLKVTASVVLPDRPMVDPLKDGLAEKMDVRGGFKSMKRSLAERGVDWTEQVEDIREFNALCGEDVVLDTNPGATNNNGAAQPNVTVGERAALDDMVNRLLEA